MIHGRNDPIKSINNLPKPINSAESPNMPIRGDMCSFQGGHKTAKSPGFFGADIHAGLKKNPGKMYGYDVGAIPRVGNSFADRIPVFDYPSMQVPDPYAARPRVAAPPPVMVQQPPPVAPHQDHGTVFVCGDIKSAPAASVSVPKRVAAKPYAPTTAAAPGRAPYPRAARTRCPSRPGSRGCRRSTA